MGPIVCYSQTHFKQESNNKITITRSLSLTVLILSFSNDPCWITTKKCRSRSSPLLRVLPLHRCLRLWRLHRTTSLSYATRNRHLTTRFSAKLSAKFITSRIHRSLVSTKSAAIFIVWASPNVQCDRQWGFLRVLCGYSRHYCLCEAKSTPGKNS